LGQITDLNREEILKTKNLILISQE
jgi:hypothetical protein